MIEFYLRVLELVIICNRCVQYNLIHNLIWLSNKTIISQIPFELNGLFFAT